MEIEIKMAGSGAIESGKVEEGNIEELGVTLTRTKNDPFLEVENPRGPVLINKSNILTIKKGR